MAGTRRWRTAMGKRFGKGKFSAKGAVDKRKENTREEKRISSDRYPLLFSFKDWDNSQCPPGQTWAEWEKEGLLAPLMDKLVQLSQKDRVEASQQQCIKVYGSFPVSSDFNVPRFIEGKVEWAVIEDVGGQKHRVAGYMVENVFYVVFLDKEHEFWKMANVKR